MAQTLVLVAHPQIEHSCVTRRLMRRAAGLGPAVAVRDLFALDPDDWIDVGAEQAALAAARLVVWLQPVHWYGMLPLLKRWLLPPYERTAARCAMRWLPPLVPHGAHRVGDAELDAHAGVFADRLASHPHWPELAQLDVDGGCAVPAD